MRIVAGRFRGRRLHGPRNAEVRPTADRMKESIYNVLQGWFPGARVADLCAGSGSLGLEAVSRGASRVVLVERSSVALALIERNVELLGVGDEVEVVRADAVDYLARDAMGEGFDLVLADPPYAAGAEDALLEALGHAGLSIGACFVLQHRRTWRADSLPNGFRLWRSKRFGDTIVDFWMREEEPG